MISTDSTLKLQSFVVDGPVPLLLMPGPQLDRKTSPARTTYLFRTGTDVSSLEELAFSLRWNTCSFDWFRTRSYLSNTQAHPPPKKKTSHTKWLNDELFHRFLESLTRHIYYSISAAKGDGAPRTCSPSARVSNGSPSASLISYKRRKLASSSISSV